ncbi:MAG: L-threonylcarbamoyladenylate synthase [Spirochaetales bacterium]|nr:L-threonylcarbamoyladenylate synthase [Spirochaetales bacterium]
MIVDNSEENIRRGAEIIKKGGLVAFPTETVYGLGGNSLDPRSAARIFEAKERPSFDPLITHIADLDMLEKISPVKDKKVFRLIEQLWPGALTIIVPKRDIIPDLVTSGLDTMAVRMPDHPTARELIRLSTGAVAAPSANPFGYLSPTRAQHVEESLGSRIDLILDGGECRVGVESTVLDMTRKVPTVLRPGGIEVDRLREILGDVEVLDRTSKTPKAPGQLPMHYSPRKPLHIVDSAADLLSRPLSLERAGFLSFKGEGDLNRFGVSEILSHRGDFVEAASRLFAALHSLDRADVDLIYAERVPSEGLGAAVMDRIYKASEK